jgi:hypothetical protein
MARSTRMAKGPLIPEPSPRFIRWSATAAGLMIAVTIGIILETGWKDLGPSISPQSTSRE